MESSSSSARERRARVVVLAVALAGLISIAHSFWGPHVGFGRSLAAFVLLLGALFIVAGLAGAFRAFWHAKLRGIILAAFDWIGRWHRGRLGRRREASLRESSLRPGERIALAIGLALCVLDVVLTVLLLRDVFPEPPYRFDLFGLLGPEQQEWVFYVSVAAFKTMLELWFGMFDRTRMNNGRALRWFILGGASAFDGVLAAARGVMLAEQGLGGGPVFASNVLFVGFGVAIPWVVAHTGGLLAEAIDPFLERYSLLRLLAAIPRALLLGLGWLLIVLVGAIVFPVLSILGITTAIWIALEGLVGIVLGQGDPHEPVIVLKERASEELVPRDRGLSRLAENTP